MATISELLKLAIQHQQGGRLNAAEQIYRQILQASPNDADALHLLGAVIYQQGNLVEAAACFRRALDRAPNDAEAYDNLGSVFKDQGNLDEAIQCFRQAIALCRRALSNQPQSAELHNHLGKLLGQIALILGGRLPEADLIAMRQCLAEPLVGGNSRIVLEFALAHALDARGEFNEAAIHLQAANTLRAEDLRSRGREYRPADAKHFVDSLITTFTRQLFSQTTGFGLETDLPVFVFGLPRSGTTLVEQILASHSQVFGAGELAYCEETFNSLPEAMRRSESPLDCLPELDRATALQLAQRHADRLQALDKRAARIVDKLPDNYFFLGLIAILFPRARLIHCCRDLRDIALSCWMTDFGAVDWACDTGRIAFHCEEYCRLMDHWRKVLPLPVLDVDYEGLVNDPEGTARRMISWCGLEWEPDCLKFYETSRTVQTASAVQVRRPIYTTSIGRWRNYQQSLSEMFLRIQRSNCEKSPRAS